MNYHYFIPNLNFNYYGLSLIIGFIVFLIILFILGIKEKFKEYEIASIIALEVFAWIIAILFFRSSFYALILIMISGLIFFLITKKNSMQLFAMLVFSVPLVYAIGKIGCFVNGCCYGIDYSGPFHVIYEASHEAPNYTSLFPIQFAETIVNLIIFLVAIILYHKKKDIRYTLPFNLIACSIAKFSLDFLRANRAHIFTLNQVFCIITITIGIILIIKIKKKPLVSN